MKNYILSLKSILTHMKEKEDHIWLLHSPVAETTLSEQALRSVSRFKMNIPKWEGPDETQINTKQLGFRESSNKSEERFQWWLKSKGMWNSNQDAATWWRKCLSDQAKMLLFLGCLKETLHRHWNLPTLRRTMQARGKIESGLSTCLRLPAQRVRGHLWGRVWVEWVSEEAEPLLYRPGFQKWKWEIWAFWCGMNSSELLSWAETAGSHLTSYHPKCGWNKT